MLKHRLIMERHLSRKLKTSEVVHHINSNRADNRIENLMLFASNSEHATFHHRNNTSIRRNIYKRLTCEIDIELHRKAKVKAYQEGIPLTQKIIHLVSEWAS